MCIIRFDACQPAARCVMNGSVCSRSSEVCSALWFSPLDFAAFGLIDDFDVAEPGGDAL